MPDFLQSGVDWLTDVFADEISQSCTYRRGSNSVPVSLTPGRADQGFAGPVQGVSIQRDGLDFIVRAADLIINSAAVEPQENDVIDYDWRRYRVAPPGDQMPCFETDEYRLTYRIHTKFRAVI